MEEIWKDVVGYNKLYQVSNFGRVKSLSRMVWNGKAYYRIPERIIKNSIDSKGYHFITLCKDGTYIQKRVHQIMAECFFNYSYKESGLVVNHKDFNRINNILDNLEVVTHRENTNMKHIPHSSKYTGVHWNKKNKKWDTIIRFKGKIIRLGTFIKEEEASMYYENALKAIIEGTEIIVKKPIWSSKYKGVSFCKRTKKWTTRIWYNGKNQNLGTYSTELEAASAVASAKEKLGRA